MGSLGIGNRNWVLEMNKNVMALIAGIGTLSFIKGKFGSANLDLSKWKTWDQWQFEDASKDFIRSFDKCNMSEYGLTGLRMLGEGKDVWNVLDLYNISQYAFQHKVLTGESRKIAMKILKYKTWSSKHIDRLIDAHGDLSKIVNQMMKAQNKSQAMSLGHTTTSYFYPISDFKIDNSSGLTGAAKKRLDDIFIKLIEIGNNTDLPFFKEVIEGDVRYVPDLGNRLGTYDTESGLVTVRSYSRRKDKDVKVLSTLVHEFAHKIYYTKLSDTQKKMIDELWKKSVKEKEKLTFNWIREGAPLGFKFTNDNTTDELVFHAIQNGIVMVKYPSDPENIIRSGYTPRKFQTIVNNFHRGILPTWYANKNPSEMFAEIVAAYIVKDSGEYKLEDHIEKEIKKIMGVA